MVSYNQQLVDHTGPWLFCFESRCVILECIEWFGHLQPVAPWVHFLCHRHTWDIVYRFPAGDNNYFQTSLHIIQDYYHLGIFFITKIKSFILHNICTLYGSLFYIYFRSATPLCNNLIDLSDMIFRNLRSTDFQLLLLQWKTVNHLHLNQCHL